MINLNVILEIVNKALKDTNLCDEGYKQLGKKRNWGLDKPKLSLKTQPEPGIDQCLAKRNNQTQTSLSTLLEPVNELYFQSEFNKDFLLTFYW